jgi:hypothetical protein
MPESAAPVMAADPINWRREILLPIVVSLVPESFLQLASFDESGWLRRGWFYLYGVYMGVGKTVHTPEFDSAILSMGDL